MNSTPPRGSWLEVARSNSCADEASLDEAPVGRFLSSGASEYDLAPVPDVRRGRASASAAVQLERSDDTIPSDPRRASGLEEGAGAGADTSLSGRPARLSGR